MLSPDSYSPEKGFMYRISFITKSFLAIVLIVAGFLPLKIPHLGILAVAGLLSVMYKTGILRRYLFVLAGIYLPFCFFLFLVYTFFLPTTWAANDSFWTISINYSGFLLACRYAEQVLVLMAVLVGIMMTTYPPLLVRELRDKGCPAMLCYILLASFSLIPVLRERAATIIQAQKARGLDLDGNLMSRILAVLPLLAPLVFGALANIEERAAALEIKGFRLSTPKSSIVEYHELKWEPVVRYTCVALLLVLFAGASI